MHLCPLFRADYIGSRMLPAYLPQKRQEFIGGKITAENLVLVENHAIDDAVKMQREIGIK